jgi:hypothetical protein
MIEDEFEFENEDDLQDFSPRSQWERREQKFTMLIPYSALNIMGYPICDRLLGMPVTEELVRATCTASTPVVSRSEIVSIDF